MRWRRVGAAVFALLVVFAVATWLTIVHPATDRPAKVDVIEVLGGANESARLAEGWSLAARGYAGTLFVSAPSPDTVADCHFRPPPRGVRLLCFRPDPSTTQGEARALRAGAERYHWTRAIVVVTNDQATRARVRIRRCYSGALAVVTVPTPAHLLPKLIAYQWAALVKAETIQRGC